MLAGCVDSRLVTRVLSLIVLSTLAGGFAGAATLPGHPGHTALAFHHSEPQSQGSAGEATSVGIGQPSLALRTVRDLTADSRRFLSTYMEPEGRIVRRDQGGDTVSEGQAYGMLVAAAGGDRGDFNTIWSWTREHLSRPDGLLSWHWQDGRLVDQMAASDGDIDAAWALAIAAGKFAAPAFAADARRIASSVMANEVEQTDLGPVLVAGPWAVRSGTTEPGYFSPEAFSELARLTGDPRWSQMEAASEEILQRATSGGRLPSEWIAVSGGGAVMPIGSPSRAGEPTSYGLGAARVAAWWSASCSASERRVAAGEWPLLAVSARSGAFDISLSLVGQPRTSAINATMAVADGLAASAAGQREEAVSLLSLAAQVDRRYPTYYGGAWIALAYLLTATAYLGNCPP